jgi:hypothetical protein
MITDSSERETKVTKKKEKASIGGVGGFLRNYKGLAAKSIVVAVLVHLLLIVGFGGYTIFKGSAPRMPFTSENGVPAEEMGSEAPPTEVPEKLEEPQLDSAEMPSDQPALEADTVIAVSGMVSPPMSFTAAPPPMPTAPASGAEKLMAKPGTRGGGKPSTVNFFGAKGEGTNVYFVVDVSDSMVETDKGGIDGYKNLKEKLAQMIASLAPETHFNVVFYGDTVDLFSPESVPATPENQKAARDFLPKYMASTTQRGNILRNFKPKIATLPSNGGTSRMDLGLVAAFEGRADTIFVLTDGKPVIHRGMTEEERKADQKKRAGSEISEADRQKYANEFADWRKEYEKYVTEIKAYQEKYKDKLAEKAKKEAENRAKGKGKVVEGQGFIVEAVKIPGLLPAPTAPVQPAPPQAKKGGQVVASSVSGDWTDDQIFEYLKSTLKETYRKDDYPLPSIHAVAFMSKPAEEKFLQSLVTRNNGKFIRISAPLK